MSKSFLFCFIAFASLTLNAKILYVSPTGTDNTASVQLKTITYASTLTVPGDTVWVKAGTYNEKAVFSKSGILGKPISFLGYKAIPGDHPTIIANKKDPYAAFTDTSMPLFDGIDRTTGTGFNLVGQEYVTIKNFQIKNYAYGLMAGGVGISKGNLNINNVAIANCGNVNSSYSGYGFLIGNMSTKFSNNNILTNCIVTNVCAEGMGIYGDSNTLTNCKVYCNENSTPNASTDYYIITCGSYNNFNSCLVNRTPGLNASGHGLTVKSNAEQIVDHLDKYAAINPQYNNFNNCEAYNMGESFCVRHRTVQFNTFKNCRAYGTHTGVANSSGGEGSAFVTRDGASDNNFTGCMAINCNSGFLFIDTVEDGDTGLNPTGHPGNNNTYSNCLIYNCYIGVKFDSYSVQSDAGANNIQNCTFYKTRYLHYIVRSAANMKYTHNIYMGCLPATTGGNFMEGRYVPTMRPDQFTRCDFFNIEGGVQTNYTSTGNNITSDPMFTDPANMDFTLKPESQCAVVGSNTNVR